MVICSTWDLGSGTFPTRMSRAVSMRRLVSVSSNWAPSDGEFVQGDVVLDVFRDEVAVLLWHGAEIVGGESWVGGQIGEVLTIDAVAHLIACGVGLEVVFDNWHGLRLLRVVALAKLT